MKIWRIKIILFFQYPLLIDWVSEWLLLNANSAIFQLYHGENKLIINEVRFVVDQDAELQLHSSSSLKQQSAGRHVTPLGYIILIPGQLLFALSP